MVNPEIEFLPSGDTGLTVQFGQVIDRDLSRLVVALGHALDAARLPGLVETVPTYRSLLVHYDPLATTQMDLIAAIRPMTAGLDAEEAAEGNVWRLPVCFEDPDCAPDLASVAAQTGVPQAAVVKAMTETPHYVYMLGFAPGQPYMGHLPPELAIPRRQSPVSGIPAGSVLIAAGMTVIYTVTNPTGWHVVGRTPATLFDPAQQNPALLTAGDSVWLSPISGDAFRDIAARGEPVDRQTLKVHPK